MFRILWQNRDLILPTITAAVLSAIVITLAVFTVKVLFFGL